MLSFEEDHITLNRLHAAKGCGGPTQSLLTWACKVAASVYHAGSGVSVARVESLASDPQNWMTKRESVQEHLIQSATLCTMSRWGMCLLLVCWPGLVVLWAACVAHDGHVDGGAMPFTASGCLWNMGSCAFHCLASRMFTQFSF